MGIRMQVFNEDFTERWTGSCNENSYTRNWKKRPQIIWKKKQKGSVFFSMY
jgi:hypothetical protein